MLRPQSHLGQICFQVPSPPEVSAWGPLAALGCPAGCELFFLRFQIIKRKKKYGRKKITSSLSNQTQDTHKRAAAAGQEESCSRAESRGGPGPAGPGAKARRRRREHVPGARSSAASLVARSCDRGRRGDGSGLGIRAHNQPGPGRGFTAAGRLVYCPMAAEAGRARARRAARDAEVSAPDAVPAARSPAGHVAGLRGGGGGGGGQGGGAGEGRVGARGGGRPGASQARAGSGTWRVWPARLFQLWSVGPAPEKSGPAPVPGQSGAEATPRGSLAGDLDGLRGPETCRLNFAGVESRAPQVPLCLSFPSGK